MNITFHTNKDIPCKALYDLFASVGWVDLSKETTPEMLANFNRPFINSAVVISAWNNDELVGCIRALSDTMFRSVIYDLAVLPIYQKHGIGSELVRRCIAVYPDSEWTLETTDERVDFYKHLGFQINTDPCMKIRCKLF